MVLPAQIGPRVTVLLGYSGPEWTCWGCDSGKDVLHAEDFSFQGLETIESRILKLAPDIAYITLLDRTDRTKDDRLGRFNFSEAHAEPYLVAASKNTAIGAVLPTSKATDDEGDEPDEDVEDSGDEPDDDGDGDEESADDDDGGWPPEFDEGDGVDEDDDGGEQADHRTFLTGPLTPAAIARAACAWIRDCAIRNTVGETQRRFRVRVWGPKGMSRLDSGQFVCVNHGYSEEIEIVAADAAVRELRIPPPSFDQSAKDSTLKGIKALGDYYAQWGQIVLGSVGQLQGVNNAMLARLHRQLQESRGQVDELVASILEHRYNEVEAHERRRMEERAGDTRTELARDALRQFGTAASAFLAGKAIPPDLADVYGSISASPELTEVLRSPGVRALMKDPDNLRGLAAMLQAAGLQAEAAQHNAAAAAGGSDPQDAGDPPAPEPDTTQPDSPAAG